MDEEQEYELGNVDESPREHRRSQDDEDTDDSINPENPLREWPEEDSSHLENDEEPLPELGHKGSGDCSTTLVSGDNMVTEESSNPEIVQLRYLRSPSNSGQDPKDTSPSKKGVPNGFDMQTGDKSGEDTTAVVAEAEGQHYYITVDARTMASLQQGAEYTIVPVRSPTPDGQTPDRNTIGPEDTSIASRTASRPWIPVDTGVKDENQGLQQTQQNSTPNNLSNLSHVNLSNIQSFHNLSDHLAGNNPFQTAGIQTTTQHSDQVNSMRSSHQQGTTVTPASQAQIPPHMRFETPQRFQQHLPGTSPFHMLPSSHPHMLYSMPSTPHPSYGFGGGGRFGLQHTPTNWHGGPYPQQQNFSPHVGMMNNSQGGNSGLNSSGEDINVSPDYPRPPHNTPGSESNLFPLTPGQRPPGPLGIPHVMGPLDSLPYYPLAYTGRENHNEKERKRRSRIKNACCLLRDLVPGLTEKTDKATVFEYTVQYLLHMKRQVGKQFDKDFMEKYTPY